MWRIFFPFVSYSLVQSDAGRARRVLRPPPSENTVSMKVKKTPVSRVCRCSRTTTTTETTRRPRLMAAWINLCLSLSFSFSSFVVYFFGSRSRLALFILAIIPLIPLHILRCIPPYTTQKQCQPEREDPSCLLILWAAVCSPAVDYETRGWLSLDISV